MTSIKGLVLFTITISTLFGIFIAYNDNSVFAFEENILVFQTGIISTNNQDYVISQEFDAKSFQNGQIMRVIGLTTTGEQYYFYQKIVNGETVVRGKILVNNIFVPIFFNEELLEPPTIQSESNLAIVVKLSPYTYANYPFVISVKVFDTDINPQPRYDSRIGTLQNVQVSVTISDRLGNHITTLTGNTDSTGVFQDNYLVKENIVDQGKYDVEVTIEDGREKVTESFTTFFRGDIRDYFKN